MESHEEIKEEIIVEEDEDEAEVVEIGRSVNSIEQLVAEGIERQLQEHSLAAGQSVNLQNYPNVDFYYKLVAKVDNRYYSIYDGDTEYKMGEVLSQTARPGHGGGYYVYASTREAVFADVPYKRGGHYIAPRTVVKCICWGDFVVYSNGKMSFSNIMAVGDLGLPQGYKANKAAIRRALEDQDVMRNQRMEQQFELNMVRRNRNQATSYLYEDNRFEANFGAAAVREVENLIRGVSSEPQ